MPGSVAVVRVLMLPKKSRTVTFFCRGEKDTARLINLTEPNYVLEGSYLFFVIGRCNAMPMLVCFAPNQIFVLLLRLKIGTF